MEKGENSLSAILILTFVGIDGSDIVFSFPYVDATCSETQISALVNAIISNGDIFTKPPVQLKKTKLLTA